MKIVKWSTGYIKGPDGQYRQIHPDLDDSLYYEGRKLVIDAIRRNGFRFGGYYHQWGTFGVPLFDNGKCLLVSQRTWGHIMYEAWHPDDLDPMGYCEFAWEFDMSGDGGKVPQNETDFT